MEKLGDRSHMAREVAFCPLWYTLTTPGYQGVFRKASIAILDLHEGELNAAITEVVYEIHKLSLWTQLALVTTKRNLHTSGALNFQYTFFIPRVLKGIR